MPKLNVQLQDPFMFQVAIDGKYEEAIQTHAPFSSYSGDKIRELAQNYTKSVSIEFFYKTQDGRDSYFGMKHTEPPTSKNKALDFVLLGINAFIQSDTFGSFIAALERSLELDEASLLSPPPAQIELGVNGWWFTFGPQVIWAAGDDPLTKETLDSTLAGRDDLMSNGKNFVGAELIFMSPIEHWLSTQVSELVDGNYILDKGLVMDAARIS
jgi:hypothetical protein